MANHDDGLALDLDLFDNTKNRKPSSAAEEAAVPIQVR